MKNLLPQSTFLINKELLFMLDLKLDEFLKKLSILKKSIMSGIVITNKNRLVTQFTGYEL